MITNGFLTRATDLLSTPMLVALVSSPVAANCDSINGPVVEVLRHAYS